MSSHVMLYRTMLAAAAAAGRSAEDNLGTNACHAVMRMLCMLCRDAYVMHIML